MRDNIEGYQNIWRCALLTGIEKKWDAVKIPNLIHKYTNTQIHKYTNTQQLHHSSNMQKKCKNAWLQIKKNGIQLMYQG